MFWINTIVIFICNL